MERLTIKELAPYFPYGLKVHHTTYFDNGESKTIVVDVESLHNECVTFSDGMDYYFYDPIDNECSIKPLLRPLSSLTEEIEHNGERFVPIDKLELEGYVIGYNGFGITIGQEEGYSFGYAIDVYNQIIQNLHEWHFDTANLLGRGLALPIDGKEVEGEL